MDKKLGGWKQTYKNLWKISKFYLIGTKTEWVSNSVKDKNTIKFFYMSRN